jgi:hypothetical protein
MPFPFIGPTYQTRSLNVGVERVINFYSEITESPDEATRAAFYGTPGLKLLLTLPDGPCRGLFAQDMQCFIVVGAYFIELIATLEGVMNAVSRGFVANDGLPVTMCTNGVNGHQLFIVAGGRGYIYDLKSSAFTLLPEAMIPPACLMGAFLDGYFIALWADHFQLSELMNGLSWAAADTARPSITSDHLNAMKVHHRELWLFGERTTEVWYNAGTSPFPFAPVPGVLVEMGTQAPWTVCTHDDALVWIGQNASGARLVVAARQYAPQRLSTHAVEWALHGYQRLDDFRAFSYQEGGHTFYVLTSPSNQATWAFDSAVPPPYGWSERAWWNSPAGRYEAQRQVAHCYFQGFHVVGDRSGGNVYSQRLDHLDDAGAPIRSMRRLPHPQADNRMTFYTRFELGLEPGVGAAHDGTAVDPQLMLRWSDDGGYTWSPEQWTTAGRMGQYETRAVWHRLGRSRSRVFEVVQSDRVKRAWLWARVDARAEMA